MGSHIQSLSFALLTASAALSHAAPEVTVDQRVEITTSREPLVAAEAVLSQRNLDATYEMSTGHRMTVSYSGAAVRMRYGRQKLVWLRHDGQGSFVSGDGQLSLQFTLDGAGDPHAVRLSMPKDWL